MERIKKGTIEVPMIDGNTTVGFSAVPDTPSSVEVFFKDNEGDTIGYAEVKYNGAVQFHLEEARNITDDGKKKLFATALSEASKFYNPETDEGGQ